MFSVEIMQKEVRVVLYEGHVSVVGPVPGISGSHGAQATGGEAGRARMTGAFSSLRTLLSVGQELIAPLARSQVHVERVDAARS